jgi:hypothetical protein
VYPDCLLLCLFLRLLFTRYPCFRHDDHDDHDNVAYLPDCSWLHDDDDDDNDGPGMVNDDRALSREVSWSILFSCYE